jgi:Zn-dependent peptidase ImmA (M78 family)
MTNKITYKDFKLGQKVICYKNKIEERSFYKDRLVIGKEYQIVDLDYHFPNEICVELIGPHYYHSEFVPIIYFIENISEKRDRKLFDLGI